MKRQTYMRKKRRKQRILSVIVAVMVFATALLSTFMTSRRETKKHEAEISLIQEQHDEAFSALEKKLHETEQRIPEYITVLVETEPMGPDKIDSICLGVDVLLQQPELPAGCEATSLTACLNYLGFDADKVDVARTMPQGEVRKTDPDLAFVGNPESRHSYGCNAPVVVKTAETWLAENAPDTDVKAFDLSGHEFEDLLGYVEKGYPVMIWGLEYMQPSPGTTSWYVDGKEITWIYGFHCLVLIGWNEQGYIIMDPEIGFKLYDKDDVEQCYIVMHKQAVVLQHTKESD